MANLVPITDPASGRVYYVHPHIAEHGDWFARDKAALRAQLPGIAAFERGIALAATHAPAAPDTQHTPLSVAVLEKAALNA